MTLTTLGGLWNPYIFETDSFLFDFERSQTVKRSRIVHSNNVAHFALCHLQMCLTWVLLAGQKAAWIGGGVGGRLRPELLHCIHDCLFIFVHRLLP